jgi:hypothetical protein
MASTLGKNLKAKETKMDTSIRDSNYDCVGVSQKLPGHFRAELAEIQAGAKVGGVIPPRRGPGLLVEIDRLKSKYDAKLDRLRSRGLSHGVDEASTAINKAAGEFASAFSNAAAA